MKLLRVAIIAALTLCAGSASAGDCVSGNSCFQFADEGAGIAVSSTAVVLTASIYAPAGQRPADLAVCTVTTDAIMTRADGRAPTATDGDPQAVGKFYIRGTVNIRRFQAIRVTTDANLKCTYSREGDN